MHNAPGFADQKPVEFEVFGYNLSMPSNHLLLGVLDAKSRIYEPYRESGLIKLAKVLGPRLGTAIDIGANVGDTCAIIYRHTKLKIICVDASDFFFPYLQQNIGRHFSDRAVAEHVFVTAAREEAAKRLYHSGSTATRTEGTPTESCGAIFIGDLIDNARDLALLKVDIDGPDIELVAGAFRHLGTNATIAPRFPIYFEFEFVGTSAEEIRLRAHKFLGLSQVAVAAGYTSAFLWDAPGRFYGLLNLERRDALVNAINYLGAFQTSIGMGL